MVPVLLENIDYDDDWLDALDVLVWIQPNNPTGLTVPVEQLLRWHQRLQARGGTLVIDEAFVTNTSNTGMAPFAGIPGLVVLRSLGKFFGLAGVRAGAVISEDTMVRALGNRLGPWAVSGPARYVMKLALEDRDWQARAAKTLNESSTRLHHLLAEHGLGNSTGTVLFRYLLHPEAAQIQDALAQQGILVRLFEKPAALRFGLPGAEAEWQRLAAALIKCH